MNGKTDQINGKTDQINGKTDQINGKNCKMAEKCFGCMSKFKFREKRKMCPECHRNFCSKCLDPKKSAGERETCVYCSRKQKAANKSENADILQNFHSHFYKRHHQGPAIVTKVQIDATRASPQAPGALTAEEMALEERFLKLKEPDKPKAKVCSEGEMQQRLDELRNESKAPSAVSANTAAFGGCAGQNEKKTDFKETQDLMNQMSEEARLDQRLEGTNRKHDEQLFERLSKLKGTGESCSTKDPAVPHSESTNQHTTGLLVPQLPKEEDAEKLLGDLQKLQDQEQEQAAKEVHSADIQALLHHYTPGKTNGDDSLPDMCYPKFPPDQDESHGQTAGSDELAVNKLIEQAADENRLDKIKRQDDLQFISSMSKKLNQLREEDSDGEGEVRGKPAGAKASLDFSWQHFGSSQEQQGAVGGVDVASTMGVFSVDEYFDVDNDEFDMQVQQLLEQMATESQLDERLEAEDLSHYVDKTGNGKPKTEPDTADSSNGATACGLAPDYSAFHKFGNAEELPWCCICNEDANLRCYDCDGGLYCTRCFSEGHQQFGLFDHQYAPYKSSK